MKTYSSKFDNTMKTNICMASAIDKLSIEPIISTLLGVLVYVLSLSYTDAIF